MESPKECSRRTATQSWAIKTQNVFTLPFVSSMIFLRTKFFKEFLTKFKRLRTRKMSCKLRLSKEGTLWMLAAQVKEGRSEISIQRGQFKALMKRSGLEVVVWNQWILKTHQLKILLQVSRKWLKMRKQRTLRWRKTRKQRRRHLTWMLVSHLLKLRNHKLRNQMLVMQLTKVSQVPVVQQLTVPKMTTTTISLVLLMKISLQLEEKQLPSSLIKFKKQF